MDLEGQANVLRVHDRRTRDSIPPEQRYKTDCVSLCWKPTSTTPPLSRLPIRRSINGRRGVGCLSNTLHDEERSRRHLVDRDRTYSIGEPVRKRCSNTHLGSGYVATKSIDTNCRESPRQSRPNSARSMESCYVLPIKPASRSKMTTPDVWLLNTRRRPK